MLVTRPVSIHFITHGSSSSVGAKIWSRIYLVLEQQGESTRKREKFEEQSTQKCLQSYFLCSVFAVFKRTVMICIQPITHGSTPLWSHQPASVKWVKWVKWGSDDRFPQTKFLKAHRKSSFLPFALFLLPLQWLLPPEVLRGRLLQCLLVLWTHGGPGFPECPPGVLLILWTSPGPSAQHAGHVNISCHHRSTDNARCVF